MGLLDILHSLYLGGAFAWYTRNIRDSTKYPVSTSTSLPTCFYQLKLTLTAGALTHIDRIHIQFLSHHPTIQDLVWFLIGKSSRAAQTSLFAEAPHQRHARSNDPTNHQIPQHPS
ncbi:hypothetical protein AX14_010778 [Amanita brunnescens Koide BX004]|nr:hypothetical protein AX14_010778 [Amanita brunnescens Koide BX004]